MVIEDNLDDYDCNRFYDKVDDHVGDNHPNVDDKVGDDVDENVDNNVANGGWECFLMMLINNNT